MNQEEFFNQFYFNHDMAGFIGVEQEWFIAKDGVIVPYAEQLLGQLNNPIFTYELSACQIEGRTKPCANLKDLEIELRNNFTLLNQVARQLGFEILTREVAPEDMDLTVYPDPRYLEKVVPKLSQEKLSAACRVTGTHLHFGVGSIEEAIRVHNLIVDEINYLLRKGDHSNGERLRLYQTVSGNGIPPLYESKEHFYGVACEKGFVNNPRDCWYFVRISCHGTVEVRVFGVTESVEEIISWAQKIHNIISYPRYNSETLLG